MFEKYREAEIERWLRLRAVEWAAFPAYISQPVAPILFIFLPWYLVVLGVVVAGLVWCLFRYSFVSVPLATAVVVPVVWLKWPAAIGSSIYLFVHHRIGAAVVALVWPLLAGCIGIPGKVALIQLSFARKIAFVSEGTQGSATTELEKEPVLRSAFPIGQYVLDAEVSTFSGLHEFASGEYAAMGRTFEGERNFNAPPETFLGRSWEIQLGTVSGRIYKIAAYLHFRSKAEANPVAMQTLSYCTTHLGKPSEPNIGFFIWDTANGNVILQTAETAEGLAINLLETSRSVRQFKQE